MKDIADQMIGLVELLGHQTRARLRGRAVETIGSLSLKTAVFLGLMAALLVNATQLIERHWQDVGQRIPALRSVVIYLVVLIYCSAFLTTSTSVLSVVHVIGDACNEPLFRSWAKPTQEWTAAMHLSEHQLRRQLAHMGLACKLYLAAGTLVPLALALVKMASFTSGDQSLTADQLPLPFPFLFPEKHRSVSMYLLVYVSQAAFNVYLVGYAYVAHSVSVGAMLAVAARMRLLALSFNQFNYNTLTWTIQCNMHSTASAADSSLTKPTQTGDTRNQTSHLLLRQHLQYLLSRHQNIYRDHKTVNKGIEGFAFAFNNGISIILCLTLYLISQTDEMVIKVSEGFSIMPIVYILHQYGRVGQLIITQDECLRKAMNDSFWIDKPTWFKKALSIMITRTNKATEIRPFGLQVIHLNNFSTIMNAAYSYYNLLTSISKK